MPGQPPPPVAPPTRPGLPSPEPTLPSCPCVLGRPPNSLPGPPPTTLPWAIITSILYPPGDRLPLKGWGCRPALDPPACPHTLHSRLDILGHLDPNRCLMPPNFSQGPPSHGLLSGCLPSPSLSAVPLSHRPPLLLSPNVPSGRHSGWAMTTATVTTHPFPRLMGAGAQVEAYLHALPGTWGERQQLPRPRRHMSAIRPAPPRAEVGLLGSTPSQGPIRLP